MRLFLTRNPSVPLLAFFRLHRILAELPTEAQKGFFGHYEISPKALEMMGDSQLLRSSQQALPAHMKDHPEQHPNKKALEMFGSASLIPGKAVSKDQRYCRWTSLEIR